MSRKIALASGLGIVVVLCAMAACAVRVGGGGGTAPFIEFTIANKTFTFMLGDAGVFQVRRGAPAVGGGALVENLFTEAPSDRPVSAQLILSPSNVRVTPLDVGKGIGPMQGTSGTFDVAVKIGAASDTDPCATGTSAGTFRATVTDGAVKLDTSGLDLPVSAYAKVLTGAFTLCLEVSGDIDATITITEMGIKFGPSEPADEDLAPNDNAAPPADTGDGTDVVGPGDATAGDGDADAPADIGGGDDADSPADGVEGEGEGEGDGAGAVPLTAEDLADCWRVTVDAGEMNTDDVQFLDFIYDIDSDGNLAQVWIEVKVTTEETSEIAIIEWVRFADTNVGPFSNITSGLQRITVEGDKVHLLFEYEQDDGEDGMSLRIDNALLSGDPPNMFDAVASDVSGGWSSDGVEEDASRGPARGQRMEACPNPASENVITQEDWEDMDFGLEDCGEGTAMIMPFMLLGMRFMRHRRRIG